MLAALVPALLLGACAASQDSVGSLLVNPGKFEIYNCKQIETATKATLARERELRELIDKAEQGSGGVIVSALVYQSDYLAARADLRALDATAQSKNCDSQSKWKSDRSMW